MMRVLYIVLFFFAAISSFGQGRQWAVLTVEPDRSIVFIDDSLYRVQDGRLSVFIAVGTHKIRVEAPFYEMVEDSLVVGEDRRLERHFELKPIYSYLTVRTPLPQADILIDGALSGVGTVNTMRIAPGSYRLKVMIGRREYCDTIVEVGQNERKVVEVPLYAWYAAREGAYSQEAGADGMPRDSVPVSIKADGGDVEIWLNREVVGTGSWSGYLYPGFYAVSARKDTLEGATSTFFVRSGSPVELELGLPSAGYGALNVSSNVAEATVFLDGTAVGTTPCVIRNLPDGQSFRLEVRKGRHRVHRKVSINGGDTLHVEMNIKHYNNEKTSTRPHR